MFSKLWRALPGSTAPSSFARLTRTKTNPFRTRTRQQYQPSSFFTQNKLAFPRHTRHHALLHASASSIYGTIFMSIVMLITDDAMDYQAKQELALSTVYNISHEPDHATKIARYWATGQLMLAAYSGAEIEVHGVIRPDPSAGWADDEIEAVVMTAPDPEWEGGTLVFCQGVLYDLDPDSVYIAEHGNRTTDAAEALIVKVEEFARELGGPVRGALLLMQPNGDWKSVYFDGKRWINVVYMEWQTAASMGFE